MKLPRRPLAVLPLVLAAAVALSGCEGKLRKKGEAPETGESRNIEEEEAWQAYGADDAVAGYASEAERTSAMEAKARDLQLQLDDAVANAETDEERVRAYQEFESGRQELNEMAEEDDSSTDEYAPPPGP